MAVQNFNNKDINTTGFRIKCGITGMEYGRSLVEMLGVLAVIGVLSVGAIAGYRRAIDSQKASATIAELNQYALLASQQALQKRADLDLSELGNVTNQGYPISAVVQADPKFFEIFLKDVPASICERILDSDWSVPLVMFANNYAYTGETGICDNGEDDLADMAFQFKEDLNPDAMPMGGCVQDSDCKGGCVKCENQQCVSSCVGSERCATDQATGEKVCCPSEKRAGPMCCLSAKNGRCCNSYNQCCPWYQPLISANGGCNTCDVSSRIDVTGVTENCSVCPQRELDGNYCRMKCTEDKPLRDYYGVCRSCDDPNFIFLSSYGRNKCSICPNRVLSGRENSYCGLKCGEGSLIDKPLTAMDGTCHACNELATVAVNNVTDNCSVCPNRTLIGNVCALGCPEDAPLPNKSGTCFACTEEKPVIAPDACSVCPNRLWFNYRCILPCDEGVNAGKPLLGADGTCHPCDVKQSIDVSANQNKCTELCPNRTLEGSQCIINTCRDDQMMDLQGNCHDCSVSNDTIVQTTMCDKCPNRVKVGYYDGYCALPCGFGEYEDKPLTDRYGRCHSCDETQRIDVYWEEEGCENVCENRYLVDNFCYLK